LRRRLNDLLYYPISDHDPSFFEFRQLITNDAWEELNRIRRQRSKRTSKQARTGVIENTRLAEEHSDTYAISDLWLYQSAMRSTVGRVLQDYSDNPIELSKDIGLLSQGYALTEFGNLLKIFLVERIKGDFPRSAAPNPLIIFDDVRLRLLYFYALLISDAALLAMLDALHAGIAPDQSLRNGLDRLADRLRDETRLDEINAIRNIIDLRERIKKTHFSRAGVEEEPVDKAQRVPRLEFFVDLGFLDRSSSSEGGPYRPTPAIQRISQLFLELIEHPNTIKTWLDKNFFRACGQIYDHHLESLNDSNRRLLYFARGATLTRRRLGFIPGRIAAIAGCLIAWNDGFLLEIANAYEEVYRVPRTQWAKHIKFSGGSRLDSEFLITVDDELERKLLESIQRS
jgi:hypothetical protein